MTLPSSGMLSLNDIRNELGIAQANSSLGGMSTTAGMSTNPDPVSDFYGYTHGDVITVAWGGTSTTTVTSTVYDEYTAVTFAGRNSPNTFKPRITVANPSGSSGTIQFYAAVNTTSTWGSPFATYFSGSGSGSFYIPTSVFVDYNDVLRVRINVNKSPWSSMSWNLTLLSQYTLGAGAIASYTRTGTYIWSGGF